MARPDVQRFADAAHPAPARRTDVVGVNLQPHHLLFAFAAQIACHRPQGLRQHHRRSAVQQAKRLLCAAIDRHSGLQRIVGNGLKANIEQPYHVPLTEPVELLQRGLTFPNHPIISSNACSG